MDDLSFDPRSWAKRQGKAAVPGESAAALPEAWRTAVRETQSGGPPREEPASSPPLARPGLPLPVVICLPVALLAGAALWAWSSRAPHVVVNGAGPAAEAAPAAPSDAARDAAAVERMLPIESRDRIASALGTLGVGPDEAGAVAQAARAALTAPGELHARLILAPVGKGYSLSRFEASYADGSGAVVTRGADGGFVANAVAAALTQEIRVLGGELNSESFYTSAVSAGLVDTLVPEFINAFVYDFNLASEIQPGDTFQVAYEQAVSANGEAVGQPQLLFASLTTKAKSLSLYRFRQADGTYAWFDGNGASTKRGLMRTPVDGARITSKFGMRFHPVLHYTRLHGGVDFGAPIGTPIYAAMDGTVTSASPSACAGNMVIIRHDNGWETRYFHLVRYADGLHAGERVTQGFTVGFVGTTGTCTTGPHLHYEVHVDGQKVDPLGIPTEAGKRERLDPVALAAFRRVRDRVDVARAQQAF